jgi:hypothetical protein
VLAPSPRETARDQPEEEAVNASENTQTSFPIVNPDFGQPSRTNLAQLQTPRQLRFGVRFEF